MSGNGRAARREGDPEDPEKKLPRRADATENPDSDDELDDAEDRAADEASELLEAEEEAEAQPEGEAKGEAALEKPTFPLNVIDTPDEKNIADLQSFLIAKVGKVFLPIEGKNEAQMAELLERVKKERSGEVNKEKPGHPEYGAATRELFAAYKTNLETREVRSVMREMADMDLGAPSMSPELLRRENALGKMLPEHPRTFLERMRKGDSDFKLQTSANNQMVEVDTSKVPTADVIQRIQAAESFMSWARDSVIFDRKLRHHEHLLEERIKKEGWPKEWLDHPMKKENRAGWCMAVMDRMTDSTSMARSIESLYALRSNDKFAGYGEAALKSIPPHVHVETESRDGKTFVKSVKFDQPLDLDLKNPDFLRRRQAEIDWQKQHGDAIDKVVVQHDLATKDIKNFLFQGDIREPGKQVIVDKKTNEVLGIQHKSVLSDPKNLEEILKQAGKKREDVTIEDVDLARCRIKVGEERGESGEVKLVTIDYGVQYGMTPPINYHNLYMTPVGNAVKAPAPGEPDGKQRFAPNETVLARDAHGQARPMPAKDVGLYAQAEDLKRMLEVGVSAAMDLSMAVSGVGMAFQGVRLIRGGIAAAEMLQASRAGFAVANGIAKHEAQALGYRMLRHGAKDFVLGSSALINNEAVQRARGFYFLGHAATGLPGINRATSAVTSRFAGARDAETLKAVKDNLLADGKALKDSQRLGLSEGPLYSVLKPGVDAGFKYSNYAFAGILSAELIAQQQMISEIGKPDGLKVARERMAGFDPGKIKVTAEQERARQEEVHRTSKRMLEDYEKNATAAGAPAVKEIFDRAKQLLEPPPKELRGDALAEWQTKRKAEIEKFQTELRQNYLQFDGQRISQLEKARAERFEHSSAGVDRLREDPVLVQGIQLERNKLDAAVKAHQAKIEEQAKLGEAKDEAEKTRRREELAKVKFEQEFAQDRYDKAVSAQTEAVRGLEKSDPILEGGEPQRKFVDKGEAQKAAALAYLLLYSADGKELPKDGVLSRENITVPGWEVTKEWTERDEDGSHKASETVKIPERKINQQLTVNDLAEYLNSDLSSDVSAMRRITTSEALDRLRVIPPEMHASVLKRIAQDPSASAADRSRAIADLGAVIITLERDEAQKLVSGASTAQQFYEAGEKFGNTSRDLKKVLADIASNSSEKNNDVRAIATYMSYALENRSSKWDESDKDFFAKTILKEPPGMTYEQLTGYLKPLAGLSHNNSPAPTLEGYDQAGWERRARAIIALEKLCHPKDGSSPARDFNVRELNAALAACADKTRPATTSFVMNRMLETVSRDGVQRTRLQHLDRENQEIAMQLRRNTMDLLKNPFGGPEETNLGAQLQARMQIIEQMPQMLKVEAIEERFKAQLQGMKDDARHVALATLSAADEIEVRTFRAAVRNFETGPNANPAELKKAQGKLATAERDYILATGRRLKDDPPNVVDLAGKMIAAKPGEEKAKAEAEWRSAWETMREEDRTAAVKDSRGNDLPDLSRLNLFAYDDAELRKSAIRALGEFGASDKESQRILRERATAPGNLAARDVRSEGVADVRVAALEALQKTMSPLEFSRIANQLLAGESSPGVANKLRLHTWYSDIGLDPQSPQYQDLVQRTKDYRQSYTSEATISKLYSEKGQPYHWLSAFALKESLTAAMDSQYWWGSAPFYSADRKFKDEKNAMQAKLDEYRQKIRTDIIGKLGSGVESERRLARELCYSMLVSPPDFKDVSQADKEQKETGYSNARVLPDLAKMHEIQMEIAKALAGAGLAGSPERKETAAYITKALEKTTDYAVKRELLKGLVNLSQNKVGAGGDATESEKLIFDPNVGSQVILNVLNDSLENSIRSGDKKAFQLECVEYLRKHMTPDVMRQTNLFATLDGQAQDKDCPPALKHALWDLIADRRDRVFPVWNACRVDSVNASVEDRVQLLREAAAEAQPNLLGGKDSPNGSLVLDAKVDPSEAEARVPSAVYKIVAATKDVSIQPGDPRIPMLQSLASGVGGEGQKSVDERVRLAAAIALSRVNDSKTRSSAIDTFADVAVNGFRPGARQDAAAMIAGLSGDLIRDAEHKLKNLKVRAADSSGQAYPKDDVNMMEAARLGLLGKLQSSQNKSKEAEASYRAAFNIYMGKPQEAPIDESIEAMNANSAKINDLKNHRRFREFADTVEGLQTLSPGKSIGVDSAMYLRMQAMGNLHPEVISANMRVAERIKNYALEPGRENAYGELYRARTSFREAYDRANYGFRPVPHEVRTKALDQIGDISLRMAHLAVGYEKGSAPDLGRAEHAYKLSLEAKEKAKYPAADIAQAHADLARVYESTAQLDPARRDASLKAAAEEIEKAVITARGARDTMVLADQLRNASDFYKRFGDAAKSEVLAKESAAISEKRVGNRALGGKTPEQIAQTLELLKAQAGADSHVVARMLNEASRETAHLHRLDLAQKYAEEALAIYKAKPPQDSQLVIDALRSRNSALFKHGTTEKNAEAVESLTWLKQLQLAQSNGTLNPAVNLTVSNLNAALACRASMQISAGDVVGARRTLNSVLENEKLSSESVSSADDKVRFKSIADSVEGQGRLLLKEKKFAEAGELLNFSMAMRMKQHDGQLPKEVRAEYTNIAGHLVGHISEQLKSLQETGKMQDCGAALQSWAQINRRLNNGVASEQVLRGFGAVNASLDGGIEKHNLSDPGDPAKERAVEPMLSTMLVSQRERLLALKDAQGVSAADKAELIKEQADALAGVNARLVEHYLQTGQLQKAENITQQSIDALQQVMPNSESLAAVYAQKLQVLGSANRIDDAKNLVRKFGDSNPFDAAAIAGFIDAAAATERRAKFPGFTAEISAEVLKAGQNQINSLPADKQLEAQIALNGRTLDALKNGVSQVDRFIAESPVFKGLPDAEKALHTDSLRRLKELTEKLQKSAEQPLVKALEQWRSKQTAASTESNPESYRTLIENYNNSGRYEDAAAFAREHMISLLENGNVTQAAEAIDTFMSTLSFSNASPEQIAALSIGITKEALGIIAEMPEESRGQMYAVVGAQAARSMNQNLSTLNSALGSPSNDPANNDPLKRSEAAKQLKEAHAAFVETLAAPLAKEVERFEKDSSSTKPRCDAFYSLLEMKVAQGKEKEASALANKHFASLLASGRHSMAAAMLEETAMNLGYGEANVRGNFFVGAKAALDQYLAALPADKRNDALAHVAPILAERMRIEASIDSGDDSKALTAGANEIARTAKDALKIRLEKAVLAKNVDELSEAYRHLAAVSISLGEAADLKASNESYIRAMAESGQLQKAVAHVQSVFNQPLRESKNVDTKMVGAAAISSMQLLEDLAGKIQKPAEKFKALQSLAYSYDALTHYVNDAEVSKVMLARSEALKKQAEQIGVAAAQR